MEHDAKYYSLYKRKTIRSFCAIFVLTILLACSLFQPYFAITAIAFVAWMLSFILFGYYFVKLFDGIDWELVARRIIALRLSTNTIQRPTPLSLFTSPYSPYDPFLIVSLEFLEISRNREKLFFSILTFFITFAATKLP